MSLFKNILAVVNVHDEHQRALQRAAKVAKRNGAKLKVVAVVDKLPYFWQVFIHEDHDAARDIVAKSVDLKLNQLAGSVSGQAFEVTAKVLRGRPFVEVIREVERDGHDLVLKNALAREAPKPLFFGSVDLRILRHCPCPVWLVKPVPSRPFERIVAAVDPFPSSEEEKILNRRIMNLAGAVAQQDTSELHLVSAWSAPGEPLLAGHVTAEKLNDYVGEWSRRGQKYLRQLLDESAIAISKDRVHYAEGDPDCVLLEQVHELNADLLVMGTVARTGISSLLMGNTAEKVLRQVECSVLTLKPESFSTPLETSQE